MQCPFSGSDVTEMSNILFETKNEVNPGSVDLFSSGLLITSTSSIDGHSTPQEIAREVLLNLIHF